MEITLAMMEIQQEAMDAVQHELLNQVFDETKKDVTTSAETASMVEAPTSAMTATSSLGMGAIIDANTFQDSHVQQPSRPPVQKIVTQRIGTLTHVRITTTSTEMDVTTTVKLSTLTNVKKEIRSTQMSV